jgi:histone H3/H4
MPLPAVFDALIRTRNLAADDALVAALAEAEPEAIDAIIEALFARGQPAGLAGVVAWYHRLGEEQQRFVLASVDRLGGALRDCCSMNDPQARLNVITIVAEAKGYRLAYLLSSLLRDRSPRVRKAAATALQSLVDRFLAEMAELTEDWDEAPPNDDALAARQAVMSERITDRRQLAEAVAAGLESFDKHLHPPVVETAMWLVDELSDRFWSILRLAGGHAKRAALDIVQGALAPRLVPFAIEALAYDEFRPTVVRMLSNHMSDASMLEWMRQSWRLSAEPVAKSLRLIKQWPRLVEGFGRVDAWSPENQRNAARLVGLVQMQVENKVGLLRKLMFHGSFAGRRAALWALCDINCPASSMLLRAVADGGDVDLAPVAKRELKRRSVQEAFEVHKLPTGAENPLVGELERYWVEFESMPPAEQADRGAALLSRPEVIHAFAKGKLTSPNVSARIKALRILTATGCGPGFEQVLYALARDADSVVRSTVMTLLGQIPGATTELLLRGALRDPDSRVQANAIEALDRLASTANEPLVHEKLRDENNRTRANAVKALLKLRVREAAESLCAMLRDADPEHRRSALWVVGQLRLAPLVARIAELAKSDADILVRRRAQDVLDGLSPLAGAAEGEPMEEEVLKSAP